ncbi:hypothetical protein EI94DRAFT_1787666 [Lactarius quietus]|nr:hypothetical protein EI94DRAFT_1787666 [Lactarius quietus]
MDMSDHPDKYPDSNACDVAERIFQDHYLHPIGDDARYVRLSKMHIRGSHCNELIEKTAAALNEDIVSLMLSHFQVTSRPDSS